MSQVRKQLAGLGTQAGKKIVREPLEILKSAQEQVGVKPAPLSQGREEEQVVAKPSLEEIRAPRTLRALETELKEIRERKGQEATLAKKREEKAEEEIKLAIKEQKKENFIQKIIKRFQRRVEGPKLPQAT